MNNLIEDIKILEDLAETLNKTCENGICEASMSIEKLIKGYRKLEEKNKRYEKIYKEYGIDDLTRKIERLEEDNEELKRLANNKQWISPCYVAHNYIPKSKVKEKIEELKKMNLDCDTFGSMRDYSVLILKELMEDK